MRKLVTGRSVRIISAYLLDSVFGDPRAFPNPVKIFGKAAGRIEALVRNNLYSPAGMTAGGTGMAVLITGGAYLAAKLISKLPYGSLIETALLYTAIARKDLAKCALQVAEALDEEDIQAARNRLKSLVGRETDNLDGSAIARAAVESVGENFVDGVLSPMFWAALGGAPAALAFKSVSTLDSMYGYRDYKFRYFGKFSARADDISNLIPARISIPVIAAAALACGFDAESSLKVGIRDRRKHESPNSAHGEAAFAGALGLKLGGAGLYHGKIRQLPQIGDGIPDAGPEDIRNAVKLMNAASNAALAVMVFGPLVLRRGRKR